MSNKSYAITAPSGKAVGILILFGAIMLPLTAFVSYSLASKRSLTVDERGLTLNSMMYTNTVAKADLRLADAKVLDLQKDTAYTLRLRTNGIGLPGLMEGWFKLANDEKALAAVTDSSHVLYIPTTKGHAIMASVADPNAVLEALKK